MSGYEESYVDYNDDYYSSYTPSYTSTYNASYTQQINQIRRQAEQEYQQRLQPLEQRQRQFESTFQHLTSNLGQLERDMQTRNRATQQRLQEQQQEFTLRLRQQQDDIQTQFQRQQHDMHHRFQQQRQEYRHLIEEQGQLMTRQIEAERQQRIEAARHLQEQINHITADAARKQKVAEAFVADLTRILTETGQLPHERFAPGQMAQVQRHVQDARSSVAAGIPEAALSTAQNAYWQLTDLRALVMQKEAEFIMLHQGALEQARTILEQARAHRHCELVSQHGDREEPLALEVDYWTQGELSNLEQALGAIERRLVSEEQTLRTEEVQDMLLRLDEMQARIPAIVENARNHILSSQLRYNTAELVASALATQGFDVEAGVYEGGDQRGAYIAKVRNVAGTEVVTVISPVPDSAGKCRVAIHSYDETFVAEETLRERAKEVARLLAEEGLEVTPPACMGSADPAFRDLTAAATRLPAEAANRQAQSRP